LKTSFVHLKSEQKTTHLLSKFSQCLKTNNDITIDVLTRNQRDTKKNIPIALFNSNTLAIKQAILIEKKTKQKHLISCLKINKNSIEKLH